MRWAKADRFRFASSAQIPKPFHEVMIPKSKKPDMYWCAPRNAKRPLIPVAKTGYVRSSEISA